MTKESVLLGVLEGSPADHRDFLISEGFLKIGGYRQGRAIPAESYADLAERLWERALHCDLNGAMKDVVKFLDVPFNEFWTMYYKPIHRTIASIIALQRAGAEI